MNTAPVLDLNCDLGEGFGVWRRGDDSALLEVISSANVACGFHAGDAATMRAVCARAAALGVVVGAHVSYRDLAGFGRRFMDVDPGLLADEVLYQVGALAGIALAAGTRVAYVKPHGALYNAVVRHTGQARAVVAGVRAFGDLPVLGMDGSELLRAAERAGLEPVPEAFLDRGYTAHGTLVARHEPGAMLDREAAVRRATRLAGSAEIVAVDGTVLPARARSLCVHGDTEDAVRLSRSVHTALVARGVRVRAFAGEDGPAGGGLR